MTEKEIQKKVEWAFRNYEKLKKQAEEYIVNLAESDICTNWEHIGHGRGGYYNPTEKKAIKAAENEAVKWCYVVECTIGYFADKEPLKAELIRQRYFDKKPALVVGLNLYIQERTLYSWQREIITYATFLAIQEKLVALSIKKK